MQIFDEKTKKKGKIKNLKEMSDSGTEGIPSDVLGSYTGVDEYGEKPCQDADDL